MKHQTPQWIRDAFRDVFGPLPDLTIDDNAPWPRDQEWVLINRTIPYADTWLQFENSAPNARELLAARKCVDQLQHARPAEIRDKTREDGRFYLGNLPQYEISQLGRRCEAHGVRLYLEDSPKTSCQIYNKTRDVTWRIEDEARRKHVIAEMIEYGVPVYDATNAE